MSDLYFREVSKADRIANAFAKCPICGGTVRTDISDHDPAVHEVYAFEIWGMHSVAFDMRPYVESWANGTHRLPTREEFIAKRSA